MLVELMTAQSGSGMTLVLGLVLGMQMKGSRPNLISGRESFQDFLGWDMQHSTNLLC